jgi:hypothetical protein
MTVIKTCKIDLKRLGRDVLQLFTEQSNDLFRQVLSR